METEFIVSEEYAECSNLVAFELGDIDNDLYPHG